VTPLQQPKEFVIPTHLRGCELR